MAKVQPFSAVYYDAAKVSVADVITPPYDVISKAEGEALLAKSPYNFSHIILTQKNAQYSEVRNRLIDWKKQGVLKQDTEAAYYLYQQTFSAGGKEYHRDTLMGAVQLAEFSDKKVLPHELTHAEARTDRLELLRQAQCNLSPIFAMVRDKENYLNTTYDKTKDAAPLIEGKTQDGVQHRLWKVEKELEPYIADFFENQSLYIVDGHHRYGSALQHAREKGTLGTDDPSAFLLFAIANTFDPGLLVYPTHRLARDVKMDTARLESEYTVAAFSKEGLPQFLATIPDNPCFVIGHKENYQLCQPKNWQSKESQWGRSIAKLSVAWSDLAFLPEVCGVDEQTRGHKLSYYKEQANLWRDAKTDDLLILVPPMPVDAICEVAEEAKFMPQKSTYFYPKLGTGVLVRPFGPL